MATGEDLYEAFREFRLRRGNNKDGSLPYWEDLDLETREAWNDLAASNIGKVLEK